MSIASPVWIEIAESAALLVAGTGLGVLHFGALWRQAQALAAGDAPIRAAGAAALRFLALVAGLAAAAMLGAAALLALAAGVLIGRALVMRRVEGAAR
ncbi:ATP synthase subunit I [Jiella sonneratiae]|uniref:ATP synthase subunit I n=1 Tax=Jiella sonneratiae TaxID=2816856 RepID=A0ABS3J110_9HYPH|nr:ATP synthase subunit I [Jiella sonneratiae]MBO0903375.1 hypothetical protein [Jiella sonneratiae]